MAELQRLLALLHSKATQLIILMFRGGALEIMECFLHEVFLRETFSLGGACFSMQYSMDSKCAGKAFFFT